MRVSFASRSMVAFLLFAVAAACSSPYGLRVSAINYESKQQAGSITFTDPRLYRREALINERQEEIKYLSDLLTNSGQVTFDPEVLRDLETITSFSAALGIRFDPTAGLNFRRDQQTSAIQQEIATLRLQTELAQLKRDVELFNAALPSQTAPVNQNLGTGNTTAAQDLQSGLTQVTAQQLTNAINSLQTSLGTRLDATRTPLAASGARGSPIDTFLDRSAYRDRIESARNAASLDELHDSQGSALVRLYFSATVLPPAAEYRNALGLLRMQVVAPVLTDEEVETVYRQWLRHVNRNVNVRNRRAAPLMFSENLALQGLSAAGDLFDLAYYHYPTAGGAGCDGVSFSATAPAGCGTLVIVTPRPRNLAMFARSDRIDNLKSLFDGFSGNAAIATAFQEARAALAARHAGVGCDGSFPVIAQDTMLARAQMNFTTAVGAAINLRFLSNALAEVELQALNTLVNNGAPRPPRSAKLAQLDPDAARAEALISDFIGAAARAGCPVQASQLLHSYVPARFGEIVRAPNQRMAVYQVGPREQVQRVSTAARAADAISLAASISAQAPGSGLGADGTAGYSRSAIGRADALERVPLVVSFAEARRTTDAQGPAFGWLLGPRVTVDPRERSLTLEQQLRTYDLSVDLAVPGWWPYILLETQTAWAPYWRGGDGRTVAAGPESPRIRVNLGTNAADLASLSAMLNGNAVVRTASVQTVTPARLSACSVNSELQIVGENLWRATTVIVGGRRFDTPAVRVLPDMNGVSVSIDRNTFPALEGGRAAVAVLTPYGRANDEIEVVDAKADGSCKQSTDGADDPALRGAGGGNTGGGNAAARPVITSVSPPTINLCDPNPSFQIVGRNLRGIQGVRLGPASSGAATDLPPGDGTLASVRFSGLQMRTIFSGITSTELVVRTAQGQATSAITLVAAPCP